MSDGTFETMIASERDRLRKRLEEIKAEKTKLEAEEHSCALALQAVNAYDAAKQGKLVKIGLTGKRGRPKGTGRGRGQRVVAKRAPRGSRQESILALVTKSSGLTRGQIIEKLGLKGDKGGEQSVSNALTAMKKAKKLKSKDGAYHIA